MHSVIVVEPDAQVRDALRARHLALGASFALTPSIEEAQQLALQAARAVIMARNTGGAAAAAAAACGFDLAAGPSFVRLILAATPSSSRFIHEVERVVAESSLPPLAEGRSRASVGHLPEEFPHASYVPLARVGRARCADIVLVRNRIVGAKELLVQVEEDPDGACDVAGTLYRIFKARAAVPPPMLRHELTRHHSYIAAGPLPLEFAREVDSGREAA